MITLVVTSFAASCSFAFWGVVLGGGFVGGNELSELLLVVLAYTFVTAPFVGLAGAVVGYPIAATLNSFNMLNSPSLVAAGAIAGGCFSGVLLNLIAIESRLSTVLWGTAIGVLPGIVAAVTWWRLVERDRCATRLKELENA